jgi:ribokinase
MKEGRNPRIVVVGSINMDLTVRTSRLPLPGETIVGGRYVTSPGGKGANQAVAAARLGAEVSLLGCVGEDLFGKELLEGLREAGVDTSRVATHPDSPTGIALITVDANGRNMIVVAPGANSELMPRDIKDAHRQIAEADVLVVQLEIPMRTVAAAVAAANVQRVPVILNPAPACELPADLLKRVEIITPNETEAAILSGGAPPDKDSAEDIAQLLRRQGPRNVVMTLGEQGALVCTPSGTTRIPAYSVQAVDTTAAGDAFTAALAVAMAEGRPLDEAARFASAVAAISVTRPGAQPSMPTVAEVEEFLRS